MIPVLTEVVTKGTRHDRAERRRSKRSGRETGCWVYIPGEMLERADLASERPPWYRIWGGERGRVIVTLYRDEADLR